MTLKRYQHISGINCSNKIHQIDLGRLILVEMLQVQVLLFGKHRVVPVPFKTFFFFSPSVRYRILFDV